MREARFPLVLSIILLAAAAAGADQPGTSPQPAMRWRMIGPFRGGRTVAAAGVPQQPNVFYIGVNNGGVWKSTDFGRVWTPIFDDQPTGSIGAIAVAPSDPNTIYVGSGEGLHRPDLSTGDGIYKSTDAGHSWQHLGLRDSQQIPMIAVDPHDPSRLFVAVLGHPYGPSEERGIFRSTDGGTTFQKVLYRDADTGAMDVAIDPSNPQTVYAVLWQSREGPWENGEFNGPGSGLFKSTDGGTTWRELTGGLPRFADGLGRIGLEVSHGDPRRLYAIIGATKLGGVYRSDDGGETWRRVNDDARLWGRDGDFNEIRSDPKNPDVLYVANIVTWKSVDGGKTFSSFRGAPGGDDYHRFWINPDNGRIILLASDQGAIVTVNGGESWSSWYNQPTAQFYHVSTDSAFPYRVCGGQQESGSACVSSRGDDGEVNFRDWHPVAAEEYGYTVPDPLDPDLVYGGKISRYDRRTDQGHDISPKTLRGTTYRVLRTEPIVFSPIDPHILYFASNTLWKTTDGGQKWDAISPDLTRKSWTAPSSVGVYSNTKEATPTQRGVIYAVAPSPLEINRIWAGTDDGLIQITKDGGRTWKDVTPPQLQPWWKVSILEASHFDANTAYAAVNTIRIDDLRPHIFRTRDGGATWTGITSGIPDGTIINVVREDPKRRGLLFAGSEEQVWVSHDDGEHWQSLRLNMPASSIRDLVIHDDDLVAATHGRGFWILDDIEPIRQSGSTAGSEARLLKPAVAWRVRWNKNTDTPLPPDEPSGENPPDGAIIDYYLPPGSSGPVALVIRDAAGKVIRKYSSTDKAVAPHDDGQVPWYWIRPTAVLSAEGGIHRFLWDLHLPSVPGLPVAYPIAAIYRNTAPSTTSPWVLPGTYTVELVAGSKTLTQPLVVRMDPRVKTSSDGLMRQFTLSTEVYDGLREVQGAIDQLKSLHAQVETKSGASLVSEQLQEFGEAAELLEGEAAEASGDKDDEPAPASLETLNGLVTTMSGLMDLLQDADVAPTEEQTAAVEKSRRDLDGVMKKWQTLKTRDLERINRKLLEAKLPVISLETVTEP